MKIVKLICNNVVFNVKKDEEIFYSWLRKINSVHCFNTVRDKIYFYVISPLDDESLDDLIGFFYRYNIAMEQLSQFLTPHNKSWFFDRKKYWFKPVFGSTSKKMVNYCNA